MVLIWLLVFIAALAVVVKGSDWLLFGAERIGLAVGFSPFVVGVTIVAIGTSLPELVSSLAAIMQGVTEIVPANAIGSNIANILLIIGISAIIARRLVVSKSLIDLDIPLLAAATAITVGFVWDGQVTFIESVLLLVTYIIYLVYTVIHEDDVSFKISDVEFLPSRHDRRKHVTTPPKRKLLKVLKKPKALFKDFIYIVVGAVGLAFGAKYLIESVINLSDILNIAPGVISIAAIAFGTSLPELLVSARAAWQKKSEVALGNIFGSNVFNLLVVMGLPGLFSTLVLDEKTLMLGVPVLILATFLFIISGISRRIHMWEGAMYLLVYLAFIGKLFGWF
jgi:cation:H+ antiporter